MKRFIAALAISLTALVSCTREMQEVNDEALVLRISTPADIQTRTALAEDGRRALWTAGDKIIFLNLFGRQGGTFSSAYAVGSEAAKFSNEEGSIASFSATFSGGASHSASAGDNKLFFIYPYNGTAPELSGTEIVNFSVPAVQHPSLHSFDGAADVLVGDPVEVEGLMADNTGDELVTFNRLSCAFRIRVAGIPEGYSALQVESVSFEAEIADERHPLAGDGLHIAIDQSAEGAAMYDVYAAAQSSPCNEIVAEYAEGVTLGDLLSASGTAGIWMSMLPQTVTAFTLKINLEGGVCVNFAKRLNTNMELGSGYIRKMMVNYDPAKGDAIEHSQPCVSWTVRNLSAYTVDVDVDIDEKTVDKAFATMIPYTNYERDNAWHDALFKDVLSYVKDSENATGYSRQSFLFTDRDMTYTEKTLVKSTPSDTDECQGICLHEMWDDKHFRRYSIDYYLVVGAKDKSGNWHLDVEEIVLPAPVMGGDARAELSVDDITKFTAKASVSCNDATSRLAFYYSLGSGIEFGNGNVLGTAPSPYAGERIMDIAGLDKSTTYTVYAVPFDEQGRIGQYACVTFRTVADKPGTARILSASFDPQVQRDFVTCRVGLSSDASGLRVILVNKTDYENEDPDLAMNPEMIETAMHKDPGMGGVLYAQYLAGDLASLDDFQFNLRFSPRFDADKEEYFWAESYYVWASPIDTEGNISRPVNLGTLAGLGTYFNAISSEPELRWVANGTLNPDYSYTMLSAIWGEPTMSEISYTLDLSNGYKVVTFMQSCEDFIASGNYTIDHRTLLTSDEFEELRSVYSVDFYDGLVYNRRSEVEVKKSVRPGESYVVLASMVTCTGEYTEPVNLVPYLTGNEEDYFGYMHQGREYLLPQYYMPEFANSDDLWEGPAGTITEVMAATDGTNSRTGMKLKFSLPTEVKALICLYIPTQSVEGEALADAVKESWMDIYSNVMSRNGCTVDVPGLGSVYCYRHARSWGNVTVSSLASYWTGYTMLFVYEGADGRYNVNCYIKCRNNSDAVVYF